MQTKEKISSFTASKQNDQHSKAKTVGTRRLTQNKTEETHCTSARLNPPRLIKVGKPWTRIRGSRVRVPSNAARGLRDNCYETKR